MSQARKYVTRAEFDQVKEKADSQGTQLQVLTIRVEVLGVDLHRLTNQVADIAEHLNEVDARLDRLEAKVDRLEAKVDRLEAKVDALDARVTAGFSELAKMIADGHTALLSAVMQFAPR